MPNAKLILIRGLPGSGKTTLAKKLSQQLKAKHFEADMYFENESGEYVFDGTKLTDAHEWCFQQTRKWLSKGNTVIVSNTFVRHWEMKRYLQYCEKKDIEVEIKVCREEFQSIHDVPLATIENMRRQWQE
ncbi:ATP-binding protein [Vibrio campbellii]|uniref:ATP-binding protein n=1 Tax=Vibrio campbellii TaxID=680 RepID=UPI00142E7D48|nr:ATP-binding protein [Vibrio campbellii]NIY87408.1 ATP-binding protein [Vibrio campbellii]NVK71114.1 ATP-binding protein [Vibrio campbellii]